MFKDPKKAFGLRLRKLRTTAKVSQERMAQLAGLDRSYVGSVERGERNVSLENIVKIARALELSAKDLMDF